MAQIPKEEAAAAAAMSSDDRPKEQVRGGAFDAETEAATPFGFGKGEGYDKGADEEEWVVERERTESDHQFNLLNPIDGKISGKYLSLISKKDKRSMVAICLKYKLVQDVSAKNPYFKSL